MRIGFAAFALGSMLLMYSKYYMIWCVPNQDNTSVKRESPEKYSWWLNELESLGLTVNKANDLNDIIEVSNLTDSIKQVLFQDYKTCYNEEIEEEVVI